MPPCIPPMPSMPAMPCPPSLTSCLADMDVGCALGNPPTCTLKQNPLKSPHLQCLCVHTSTCMGILQSQLCDRHFSDPNILLLRSLLSQLGLFMRLPLYLLQEHKVFSSFVGTKITLAAIFLSQSFGCLLSKDAKYNQNLGSKELEG